MRSRILVIFAQRMVIMKYTISFWDIIILMKVLVAVRDIQILQFLVI